MRRKKLESKEEVIKKNSTKGGLFLIFWSISIEIRVLDGSMGRQDIAYIQYQQGHRSGTTKTMSIIITAEVKTLACK